MDAIFSFFETVWLVIEVSFWVSLGLLVLILLAALRKALPRRRPRARRKAQGSKGSTGGFGGGFSGPPVTLRTQGPSASAPAASSSAFNLTSAKAIAAVRKWWDSGDVDAPFKWGRAIGYPRGASHPGQSPLSFGGGRPYNGDDGPLGFTTRDTALVGAYLSAGYRISSESHSWVIEATDGFEWELDHDVPGKWICYQREW